MFVTLLTSHAPMSWSKADAPLSIPLYADTQHTEKGREKGHSVRSRYTVVVSGSCADGYSGMAGRYGCGAGVMHITGFMK
jgi:hypothetical protein